MRGFDWQGIVIQMLVGYADKMQLEISELKLRQRWRGLYYKPATGQCSLKQTGPMGKGVGNYVHLKSKILTCV